MVEGVVVRVVEIPVSVDPADALSGRVDHPNDLLDQPAHVVGKFWMHYADPCHVWADRPPHHRPS